MNQEILSNKGVPLKCVNGYIHRCKRTYIDTIYWTCIELKCRGKMTTSSGKIVSGPKDHHHEPSSGEFICRKQRNMVKKDASQNPSKKCREIYDSANTELINKLPFDQDLIDTNLKTFAGLKSKIFRMKRVQLPPLPRDSSDLVIPQDLRVTDRDEEFLSSDNIDIENRMMLLGTPPS